jgi:hypothetical protein
MTDTCAFGRDHVATTVIVTYNGWVIEVCDTHARREVDPLGCHA